MRVSHSQITTFAKCGEQYRLERVLKVPRLPGWALVGGSAFHAMTEDWDRERLGTGREMLGDFDTYLDAQIASEEEATQTEKDEWRASGRKSNAWPDKEGEAWWRHHGPIFFDRWQRWSYAAPWDIYIMPDGTPAIEVEVELSLGMGADGEETGFVGYVDRVFDDRNGGLIVFDLKSGASKQITPRQLGTYAIGLEEKWGHRPRWGTFWDARTGSTSEVYNLDWYDLSRLEYQAQALVMARTLGIFLPNPSTMCPSCSVRAYCSEFMREGVIEVPQPEILEP